MDTVVGEYMYCLQWLAVEKLYIWDLVPSMISYMQHICTYRNIELYQHCVNNHGLCQIFSFHSDSFLWRCWWVQRERSWGGWTWFREVLWTVLLNVWLSNVPYLGKEDDKTNVRTQMFVWYETNFCKNIWCEKICKIVRKFKFTKIGLYSRYFHLVRCHFLSHFFIFSVLDLLFSSVWIVMKMNKINLATVSIKELY